MKRERNALGQFDKRPSGTLLERFEEQTKRDESGCWLFTGKAKNQFGHRSIKLGSRDTPVLLAHRVSWSLYRGEIPPKMFVLHRCDVPQCVNPDHLFLGTQADNIADMVAKKRNAFGSRASHAKIDEEQAADIKRRADIGTRQLAAFHGISRQSVADIIYGRTWKHVHV